jgi:hypothetical protein
MSQPMTVNILSTPRAKPKLLCISGSPRSDQGQRQKEERFHHDRKGNRTRTSISAVQVQVRLTLWTTPHYHAFAKRFSCCPAKHILQKKRRMRCSISIRIKPLLKSLKEKLLIK